MQRAFGFAALVLGWAMIAGCGGPISQELRKEVNPNLTFEQILENPDAHKGTVVIWGGRIVETFNRGNSTVLTILQMPLDTQQKPVRERESAGRFMAQLNRFLDPALYRQGRRVTVAGTVMGREIHKLGEGEYAYPVVQTQEIHLWERYRPSIPYYGYPYFWPGWDYRYWYPYHDYWNSGWGDDEGWDMNWE